MPFKYTIQENRHFLTLRRSEGVPVRNMLQRPAELKPMDWEEIQHKANLTQMVKTSFQEFRDCQ